MGLKGALLFCTKIHTDGDYKMMQKAWEHYNLLSQDDTHAHRKSPFKNVQIAGGVSAQWFVVKMVIYTQ